MSRTLSLASFILALLSSVAHAQEQPYFRWGTDASAPQGAEAPPALPANVPAFTVAAPPPVSSNGTAVAGLPLSSRMVATSGTAKSWSLESNPSWLGVDRSSGIVSGTPPLGTTGFSFTGVGKDIYGRTASTNRIAVTTEQPSGGIGTVARTAVEGSYLSGRLSSNLPGATWALASGPSWMAVSSDGTMTGLPPDVSTSTTYPFKAVASSGGLIAAVDDTVVTTPATVALSGLPSSLGPSGNMSGQAASTFGSGATWSLVGAPTWMRIDPATGALSGTPDSPASSVVVRATRNGAIADSAPFGVAYATYVFPSQSGRTIYIDGVNMGHYGPGAPANLTWKQGTPLRGDFLVVYDTPVRASDWIMGYGSAGPGYETSYYRTSASSDWVQWDYVPNTYARTPVVLQAYRIIFRDKNVQTVAPVDADCNAACQK